MCGVKEQKKGHGTGTAAVEYVFSPARRHAPFLRLSAPGLSYLMTTQMLITQPWTEMNAQHMKFHI